MLNSELSNVEMPNAKIGVVGMSNIKMRDIKARNIKMRGGRRRCDLQCRVPLHVVIDRCARGAQARQDLPI